jgi:acyl-CoA hydrolase
MTPQEIYESKKTTIQGALAHIKSGDRLVGAFYANEPATLYQHLHTIADRVDRVTVWTGNIKNQHPFLVDPSYRDTFELYSCFLGPVTRQAHAEERLSYVPFDLRALGPGVVEFGRPNVYLGGVAPMDEEGYLYLSPSLQWEYETFRAAETRIVEVNPRIPRVYGSTKIHVSEVTCLIETDCDIYELQDAPAGEVEKQIAGYVSELIRDGDTLQFGIGKTSNAVAEALVHKHDLGIHTEMLSGPLSRLIKSGAVTNSRKTIHTGKTICGFAMGDMELYRFIDRNPDIEMRTVPYTNNPFIIAQNDNMVSVNTALQIDMTGQVCSESIGTLQFSGTGGATDFAMGAYMSKGGRGIIAVTSTAQNGKVSRIQPVLSPGAAVSISRNLTDYIVTEYGVARMRGESVRSRMEQLIAISHPDFRAELRKQARDLRIW